MTRPPLQGACLYLPATHPALRRVLSGASVPGLRVAVVCLEDALDEGEVVGALRAVRAECAEHERGPRVYVRPRNLAMLCELLSWSESASWCGFVLPKLDVGNAAEWLSPLAKTSFSVMPILESADVFDSFRLRDLCEILVDAAWRQRVRVVRIGATDLFSCIGARRPRGKTIYETVLGPTLALTATQLMARGVCVTAPVHEALSDHELLHREVLTDVESGFVGKTAIHPSQVALINEAFRVSLEELREAHQLLASERAVFQSRGAMCERGPHARWAQRILDRAEEFGVRGGVGVEGAVEVLGGLDAGRAV
jgi:citrate lyase beta subunit